MVCVIRTCTARNTVFSWILEEDFHKMWYLAGAQRRHFEWMPLTSTFYFSFLVEGGKSLLFPSYKGDRWNGKEYWNEYWTIQMSYNGECYETWFLVLILLLNRLCWPQTMSSLGLQIRQKPSKTKTKCLMIPRDCFYLETDTKWGQKM